MTEPCLIILQEVGGIPTLGGCTLCPATILASGAPPVGIAKDHLDRLEKLFRSHIVDTHMHMRRNDHASKGAC
jgi:hypothetical protein